MPFSTAGIKEVGIAPPTTLLTKEKPSPRVSGRMTAAIHVYGGDFFARPRSEWDSETSEEKPYDLERNMARFEESNEELRRQRGLT